MREIFGKKRTMFHFHVHGGGSNQSVYFMNSLSFLSEPGYAVLFGSLFIVLKQTKTITTRTVKQDYKIDLVLAAVNEVKTCNFQTCGFGSLMQLKAATFRFFIK